MSGDELVTGAVGIWVDVDPDGRVSLNMTFPCGHSTTVAGKPAELRQIGELIILQCDRAEALSAALPELRAAPRGSA